jgi:predicted metal-dependent hydrolase
MQVTINIPDEISKEIVNKMLMQFEKQIQATKQSVLNSQQATDDVIKVRARQDLAQMINKLRESAEELGFVDEDEISQWVDEARVKNARDY